MALLDRWPTERRERRDPLTGTRIEQLTAHPAAHSPLSEAGASLTPAGDVLLFTSTRGDGRTWNLFRMDLPSVEITQLTETDRLDPHAVTPAADGRRAIANLRGEDGEDGEVVAIDLETGEWETLAVFLDARLDGCHLSASGEYIITVVTRAEEVTLTAVHTEGMRTVPILEDLAGATSPRFSPDSKNSVLYVGVQAFRRSGVQVEAPALCCVEFDGSQNRVLDPKEDEPTSLSVSPHHLITSSPHHPITSPAWLGTGDEVLFIAGGPRGPLAAVSRLGGQARIVSPQPFAWVRSNPAGDRLVAVALATEGNRDSGAEIVLVHPRSGEAVPLCSTRTAAVQPTFSPDGRRVLYADRDEQGGSQLYMALLNTE